MMLNGLQSFLKSLPLDGKPGKSQPVDSETVQPISFGEVLKLKEKQLQQTQEVSASSIAAAFAALQTVALGISSPLPNVEGGEISGETQVSKPSQDGSAQLTIHSSEIADSSSAAQAPTLTFNATESVDPTFQAVSESRGEAVAPSALPPTVPLKEQPTPTAPVFPPNSAANNAPVSFADQELSARIDQAPSPNPEIASIISNKSGVVTKSVSASTDNRSAGSIPENQVSVTQRGKSSQSVINTETTIKVDVENSVQSSSTRPNTQVITETSVKSTAVASLNIVPINNLTADESAVLNSKQPQTAPVQYSAVESETEQKINVEQRHLAETLTEDVPLASSDENENIGAKLRTEKKILDTSPSLQETTVSTSEIKDVDGSVSDKLSFTKPEIDHSFPADSVKTEGAIMAKSAAVDSNNPEDIQTIETVGKVFIPQDKALEGNSEPETHEKRNRISSEITEQSAPVWNSFVENSSAVPVSKPVSVPQAADVALVPDTDPSPTINELPSDAPTPANREAVRQLETAPVTNPDISEPNFVKPMKENSQATAGLSFALRQESQTTTDAPDVAMSEVRQPTSTSALLQGNQIADEPVTASYVRADEDLSITSEPSRNATNASTEKTAFGHETEPIIEIVANEALPDLENETRTKDTELDTAATKITTTDDVATETLVNNAVPSVKADANNPVEHTVLATDVAIPQELPEKKSSPAIASYGGALEISEVMPASQPANQPQEIQTSRIDIDTKTVTGRVVFSQEESTAKIIETSATTVAEPVGSTAALADIPFGNNPTGMTQTQLESSKPQIEVANTNAIRESEDVGDSSNAVVKGIATPQAEIKISEEQVAALKNTKSNIQFEAVKEQTSENPTASEIDAQNLEVSDSQSAKPVAAKTQNLTGTTESTENSVDTNVDLDRTTDKKMDSVFPRVGTPADTNAQEIAVPKSDSEVSVEKANLTSETVEQQTVEKIKDLEIAPPVVKKTESQSAGLMTNQALEHGINEAQIQLDEETKSSNQVVTEPIHSEKLAVDAKPMKPNVLSFELNEKSNTEQSASVKNFKDVVAETQSSAESVSDQVISVSSKLNTAQEPKEVSKAKQSVKDEEVRPVEKQPKLNQMPVETAAVNGAGREPAELNGNASSSQVNMHAAEVVQQVIRHINSNLKSGPTSMHLQLNPKELGTIDIQMVSNSQGVHVTFVAEQASTSKLLETQLPQLRESLADSGVQLSGLDISQHQQSGQKGETFDRNTDFVRTSQSDLPQGDSKAQQTPSAERRYGQTSEVDYLI